MKNKIIDALGNEISVINHFYNVISTSKLDRNASLGQHLVNSHQSKIARS